jgi:hypothetical protein
MKKRLFPMAVSVLIGVIITLLSSCEVDMVTDSYQVVADGAALPAKYAIASGNQALMQECLDYNLNRLDDAGLSTEEKGRIALDALDLLAVLSGAVEGLVPYLTGESDPVSIMTLDEFYTPNSEQYLAQITGNKLIYYAQGTKASPLQRLWGKLAVGAFLYQNNGGVWPANFSDLSSLPDDVEAVFSEWNDGIDAAAASSSSPGFNGLIARLKALVGV